MSQGKKKKRCCACHIRDELKRLGEVSESRFGVGVVTHVLRHQSQGQ
jgi:hypothetical protein